MADLLYYLLVAIIIAAAVIIIAVLVRAWLERSPVEAGKGKSLFGSKADKRLEVVEQANLDGRRKLVLLRRDNVQHLIMTGGPVDVVIETGIEAGQAVPNDRVVGERRAS